MAKKRIINRGPNIRNGNMVGAGKPFKLLKDAQGNKSYRTSVLAQRAPNSTIKKQISSKQMTKASKPVAKMSFKASAKFQTPMKANITTVRFKGLQKMKQQAAKSTPTKTAPTKTIKKKPPTKGR